ncbi:MAG: hypothetical protein ABIA76_00835 [Candidatus Diapherotrites archaeon]
MPEKPKFFRREAHERHSMEGIPYFFQHRKMISFSIRDKTESRLEGNIAVVQKPEEFKGIFRSGERVLDLHIDSVNSRHIISLLEAFAAKIPELKKEFTGFYIDTPNTAIAKQIMKRFNPIEAETPANLVKSIRQSYSILVFTARYSSKYVDLNPVRLLSRFD